VAGENLDRALALSRRVVADYAAGGPTEAELADERLAQAGAYQVALATNGGVARELVAALTAGEPVAALDRYPERLLGVTRDEVVTAIRRHLHPEQLVVTAAGTLPPPAQGIGSGG
jgi:zinc protease